jgi:hypothetical protein
MCGHMTRPARLVRIYGAGVASRSTLAEATEHLLLSKVWVVLSLRWRSRYLCPDGMKPPLFLGLGESNDEA